MEFEKMNDKQKKEYLLENYRDSYDNESKTWDDLEAEIGRYVDNNGLPETAEHPMLYHEALDEYLEKNGGLTWEDYRTIIED